jgi:hypothetical protein
LIGEKKGQVKDKSQGEGIKSLLSLIKDLKKPGKPPGFLLQ